MLRWLALAKSGRKQTRLVRSLRGWTSVERGSSNATAIYCVARVAAPSPPRPNY